MKKSMITAMAIGLMTMTSSIAFAGASIDRGTVLPGLAETAGIQKNWGGEGIIGSSHDLSFVSGYTDLAGHSDGAAASAAFAGTDAQARICIYCHHPHNTVPAADMPNGYSPLWNRDLSTATFTGYDNGLAGGVTGSSSSDKRHDLNAVTVGNGTAIAGVSLLCMSCHDGVVAMNAYSQNTGSTDGKGVGGSAITSTAGFDLGTTDMSNHHPMGFDYDAVQGADAEIAASSVALVPGAGGITIADVLYAGKMECVTCHDVHNTANQAGAERFLWRTNDHSNFCLTCHLK